jgi:hypothetical protein
VLSNYINIDGKPRISLINGPLVLTDDANNLNAVVLIKGLIQKRVMLSQVYVANIQEGSKAQEMIEGIIYKSQKGHEGVYCRAKEWTDYRSSE